jgi:VanZ family protein
MHWVAVFVWMVVIFIFSTDHFSDARTTAALLRPTISWVIRKLAHWSEYFILAVLLMRALNARSAGLIPKRHMLWSVIWAMIYAVIDEWHQSFVLSRQARVADVIIDAIGAVCGVLSFYTLASRKLKTMPTNTHRGHKDPLTHTNELK